jgi:membrane associated rhomboid family serine protease
MTGYNFYQERANFGSARITWAVHRLILANILVFACQLLLDPLQIWLYAKYGWGGAAGGFVNAFFGFQPHLLLQGYLYKPFTYQFLHGSLMHLGMNMLWLFFFGPDVERALGTRQFFRFYIFCGAVGVLATFIPYVLTRVSPSVTGASGAVMGVLVAFAMIEPDRQFFLFPIPAPITARFLVFIVVVMNIITGLSDSPVSVTTHFGGMAAGFLYMRLLPRINAWQRERRRTASGGTEKPGKDKIGEAVDNIFKFEKKDRK